jgi:hypothetical protein
MTTRNELDHRAPGIRIPGDHERRAALLIEEAARRRGIRVALWFIEADRHQRDLMSKAYELLARERPR